MKRQTFTIAMFVLLIVAACSSTPIEDHYYSLVLAAGDVEKGSSGGNTDVTLLIAPVALAPFLDSYSLIIQTGSTEIQSANHHFWAEPLDRAIAKVLERDLSNLNHELTVARQVNSWLGDGDCKLRIEFDKFHATASSSVVAGGSYWLEGSSSQGDYAFEFVRSLSDDGYAHAVDVMRELLSDVAGMISQSISNSSYCSTAQ